MDASEHGLTRCVFRPTRPWEETGERLSPVARGWIDLARRELDEYFAGRLREFAVPVDLCRVDGPRRRILDAVREVGYGQTITYGALVGTLGLPSADGPRQIGAAMGSNPVLIVVPCHRVVGAGGSLTGYAGGLEAKRRLLDLESVEHAPRQDLVADSA